MGDRLWTSSSKGIRILRLFIHSGLSSRLAAREQRVGMRAPTRRAPHPDPRDFRREEGGFRSVKLALSATAMNRLLEIKQRLLEAAGA